MSANASPGGHAMSSRLRRSFVVTALIALFLAVAGAAAPVGLAADPTNTTVDGINVDATTIPQLEQLMTSGQTRSVDLTNFYLHRIRQLNPILNAVITVSPTALAGSTPSDAFIAHQLKAAGAIIIGKANLSEWANFRSGPSSSGWSGIGGQTNMP